MNNEDVVKISKALSDKNRVEIIKLLSEEELCACHLLSHFEIAQSTLSHHMKQLTDSGLVKVNKEGKWSYYSINTEIVEEFKNFLDACKKTDNNTDFDNRTCCN